jgi:hypothetical protein
LTGDRAEIGELEGLSICGPDDVVQDILVFNRFCLDIVFNGMIREAVNDAAARGYTNHYYRKDIASQLPRSSVGLFSLTEYRHGIPHHLSILEGLKHQATQLSSGRAEFNPAGHRIAVVLTSFARSLPPKVRSQ